MRWSTGSIRSVPLRKVHIQGRGKPRDMSCAVIQTWLSAQFFDESDRKFQGTGMEELDELARSFQLDECVQRDGLNKILSEHA